MSCKDNKDGSCDVEYTPYAPGAYDVNITYGGQHIPGTHGPAVDRGPKPHVVLAPLPQLSCKHEEINRTLCESLVCFVCIGKYALGPI